MVRELDVFRNRVEITSSWPIHLNSKMKFRQFIRRLNLQKHAQYDGSRRFINGFNGKRTGKVIPRMPEALSCSWPSAIFVAGVTGAGLLGSWLYASRQLSHHEEYQAKYADHGTMLKVRIFKVVAIIANHTGGMSQGVEAIADALGPESITMDDDDIEWHSNSEASTSQCVMRPVAVVSPKTTEEVSIIARICSEYKIPMSTF